jgi:cyclophilin family peptidyl-prolyl cis-trans isomerase
MIRKKLFMPILVIGMATIGLTKISGCYTPDTTTYTLTILTSGNGKTSAQTGEFAAGENVVIVATPDDGWEFDNWSGDDTSKNARLLVVMDRDKTVTATFTKIDYTLSVSVQGQGSVNPSSGTYEYGEQITLTATPADGWQFTGWSGSVNTSSNPIILTIDSNKNITAVFKIPENEYSLTVTTTGNGSVSPNSGKYDYGSLLELQATADAGWHFVRWGGNITGPVANTKTDIYLTQDTSVTALFEKNTDKYNLSTSVRGSGKVDPTSGSYTAGTEVTLTATPSKNYHFLRWTGDITGVEESTKITMNATRNITAVFEADADKYTLAANVLGKGSVTPSVGNYNKGTTLSITATPADGWYFNHWLGDVSQDQTADATISLVFTSSKEITAVFKKNPKVILETTKGNITLELNMAKAPGTVTNFLTYVQEGFYDGQDGNGATIFHRVISGFMIQGGGLTTDLTEKVTHDPIPIESNNGLKNDAYTIAMARTSDPDSATSQFFINLVNNDYLNYSENPPGYTVFGKVIDGKDVVDAIGVVATHSSGIYDDVPVDPITITKVSVVTP